MQESVKFSSVSSELTLLFSGAPVSILRFTEQRPSSSAPLPLPLDFCFLSALVDRFRKLPICKTWNITLIKRLFFLLYQQRLWKKKKRKLAAAPYYLSGFFFPSNFNCGFVAKASINNLRQASFINKCPDHLCVCVRRHSYLKKYIKCLYKV